MFIRPGGIKYEIYTNRRPQQELITEPSTEPRPFKMAGSFDRRKKNVNTSMMFYRNKNAISGCQRFVPLLSDLRVCMKVKDTLLYPCMDIRNTDHKDHCVQKHINCTENYRQYGKGDTL